ncbi:MAG: hypothetical protein RDU25_05600 [Patescibacteria group bacterium]|nr:hypothetical protein [Patescibacteria group bacterium]
MLKGKIISLSGDSAIVQTEDGQSLNIKTGSLEGRANEGQDVAVIVVALGGEDAGRQELARHLLNELLKG